MDKALSGLSSKTNLASGDLIAVSEDLGGGSYESKNIPSSAFDMVKGVRFYGVQASYPSSPTPQDGDQYYNSTTKNWKVYDGALSKWVIISRNYAYTITSSTYTAGANGETIILANAASNAITISLPSAASSTNDSFFIKKIDSSSNAITIDGDASEQIDGEITKIISIQYTSIQIVCDGSNWFII